MASSSASILCQFVEASVHLILYARHVYPQEIFERRRLFDVTVFRSRHVELNDHIALVARGVRSLIERGEADALVVSILSGDDAATEVVERFRLDFHRQAAAAGSGSSGSSGSAAELDILRAHLRGFLLKLHMCDTLLPPLPADARLTFSCELHTHPTHAAQPLPPDLLQQWTESQPPAGAARAGGAQVIPLKSAALDNGLTLSLNVLTVGSGGYAATGVDQQSAGGMGDRRR